MNSTTIQDELRANAEINAQKFFDLAKQMEAFFLQKRYLLAVQKPELNLMEVNMIIIQLFSHSQIDN